MLNLGLSAFPWRPGEAPLAGTHFSQWGHLGFAGGVKCCGNEAVFDLSLLSPLAVGFTGEKEMPLSSDVFNCCINDILIL